MENWKNEMRKKPNIIDAISKGTQSRLNDILPDKYHNILTSAIKSLTKVVLFGSKYTSKPPMKNISLLEREKRLKK